MGMVDGMNRGLLVIICLGAMIAQGYATSIAPPPLSPAPPLDIDLKQLLWPEVKNAEALVELARTELAGIRARKEAHGAVLDHSALKEFSLAATAGTLPEGLVLMLRTHPMTGQVLIVTPDPVAARDMKLPRFLGRIEDTAHPHIKHAILREPPRIEAAQFETPVIRWKDFKNLDRERVTTPWPRIMQPPSYPQEMLWAGIVGMAELEFTVTKHGTVTGLTISATHVEFEPVIRDAAAGWRFEPGVDVSTRLPADARITLTVRFEIVE